MRTKAARLVGATLGVPAVAVAMAWALRQAWAGRLPDTVAVHWGTNGVDRGASLDAFTSWTFGASGVLGAAGAALAVAGLRRGYGMWRSATAFATSLATLPAACLIGSMWATRDAPSWEQAAGAGGVIAVTLGVSAAAAALGAVIAGPGVPPTRRDGDERPGPSLGLAPGERAAWVGGTTNVAMAVLLALTPPAILLLAGLLTGFGSALAGYAIAVVSAIVVALLLARLRVAVDTTGVTIRMGAFGLPRRHVPLGDIAGADVESLSVLGAGGFGIRVNPVSGYTAYKIRSGPALALRLHSGYRVLVTVDRPEQAAGLVNDLIRHESPNHA